MIRRTPTAITITSEDVQEARASLQALRDAQSGRSAEDSAATAASAANGGDVSGSSSVPDDSMAAAADHLEEQRRRREAMSRNERIGL
jgi:hypothetical protein